MRFYGPHIAPPADVNPTLRRGFEVALAVLERIGRPADLSNVLVVVGPEDHCHGLRCGLGAAAGKAALIRSNGFVLMFTRRRPFVAAVRALSDMRVAEAIERCSGPDRLALVVVDGVENYYAAPLFFPVLSRGGQA